MRIIQIDDLNAVLPQTLLITCIANEQNWDISNIEIYADATCRVLLADDISIWQLPPSSQLSIYAALNAYQHELDQRRFAAQVRAERAA